MRPYDHDEKAGNAGDVVKHVALIAALDSAIDQHRGDVFNYADTFAGQAQHCLLSGGKWKGGIGKLHQRGELRENPHTAIYYQWYLSRPNLEGGLYPGSSRIAADVCTWRKKAYRLLLWDKCEEVVANLKREFSGKEHEIYHCAASTADPALQLADFILIDPPDGNPKQWKSVLPFLVECKQKQMILLWWPIFPHTTAPPSENRQSQVTTDEALKRGFSVSKVRWAKGGRTIGCLLIYRLSSRGITLLRAAIDEVVKGMGWGWEGEHF